MKFGNTLAVLKTQQLLKSIYNQASAHHQQKAHREFRSIQGRTRSNSYSISRSPAVGGFIPKPSLLFMGISAEFTFSSFKVLATRRYLRAMRIA